MAFREKLNQGRGGIVLAVICVVAAVALLYLLRPKSGFEGVGDNIWVYSIKTEVISKMPAAGTYPPVELNGETVFQAFVYSCSTCGDGNDKVAFLTKYTVEAKKAVGGGEIGEHNLWVVLNENRSRVIATVDDAKIDKWAPWSDARELKLLKEAAESCDGNHVPCVP